MKQFLKSTEIVDWHNPGIISKAKSLSAGIKNPVATAKSCFEWVRDEIKHIDDFDIQTVSVTASEVLQTGSGICYAKSHLLAALLRANSLPAGFCYQRISLDDNGTPFCLHGLNAVLLPETGWYRIDSRGNKEGVNAQFNPPKEQLAFPIHLEGEMDFDKILPDPLPVVIEALNKYRIKDELWHHLPDLKKI